MLRVSKQFASLAESAAAGCGLVCSQPSVRVPRLWWDHSALLTARPPIPGIAGAQWEKAQELFEQMQHRGCKPDAVTFGEWLTAAVSVLWCGSMWQTLLQYSLTLPVLY